MKRIFAAAVLIAAAFFFSSSSARAEWYRWVDKDGVLHITDDIGKVPEEARGEAEVYVPTAPGELKGVDRDKPAPAPAYEKYRASELYGGETLEWWKENFRRLNQEIGEVGSNLVAKEQYVSIFEGGRRFGQIYGTEEVGRYNQFKREIEEDRKKLEKLGKELEELKRKGRIAGVPRVVME